MGNTKGSQDEIITISDGNKPNILDAVGILIGTFTSPLEPNEVKECFKGKNRSFLLFDLNDEGSKFNINKPEIQAGLFGFLRETNNEELGEKFTTAFNLPTSAQTTTIVEKQQTLEEQLQVALEDEDYEKAAKIRDVLNNNTPA